MEMNSVYAQPDYRDVVAELRNELHRLQAAAGDTRHASDVEG